MSVPLALGFTGEGKLVTDPKGSPADFDVSQFSSEDIRRSSTTIAELIDEHAFAPVALEDVDEAGGVQ